MQYREVTFTFPEEATDRDRLVIALQSPYSFVRWCRTQVGIAPNNRNRVCGDCVVEQYLRNVTEVQTYVDATYVRIPEKGVQLIITPTWAQRVVGYVDTRLTRATYNEVANMLMGMLERNELA